MANTSSSLIDYLRVVASAWRDDPRDDAELLAGFADGGDETAFRVLVSRHGPLVWQTCAGVLGNGPDAEDAFQAAFLALARKAGRLRRGPLAGWLHRVARQAALNAYAGARRRRELGQRLPTLVRPEEDPGRAELYAVLDEELAGLPEKLRVPLVLRYLEGKTQVEVAGILGCARSVALKRLARGEALLRERLERRGLAVGVCGVAVLLTGTARALPAQLVASTARLAVTCRAGALSGGAAQGALWFLPGKAGWARNGWLALLLGACVLGAGAVGWQVLAKGPATTPPPAGPPASPARGVIARPVAGPRLTGRVLGATGRPIPRAAVAVLSRPPGRPGAPHPPDRAVRVGQADAAGWFHLGLPRDLPAADGTRLLRVLATAPDRALAAVEVLWREGMPPVEVVLREAAAVRGVVVRGDKPVAGARVRVWRIGPVWVAPSAHAGQEVALPVPFWPAPAVTDGEGRFTFHGLNQAEPVVVEVLGPTPSRADYPLRAGQANRFALRRAKLVTGRVVAADSGRPVAGARVYSPIRAFIGAGNRDVASVVDRTDADGRFRLWSSLGDYGLLHVEPPHGSGLAPVRGDLDLDGRDGASVEISLPRPAPR
jgi:RNA polymerase sigma factor (sigma-70 family)